MAPDFKQVAVVESKWITRQKLTAISHPGEYPFELAEAARYLRLPPSRLRIYLVEGNMNGKPLPLCYQSGRHFYFLRQDLDAFLGLETPTLATADRPIKQLVQFLDELPLTNRQRAQLLGVRAATLQRLRDNRLGRRRRSAAGGQGRGQLSRLWPIKQSQSMTLTKWCLGSSAAITH